MDFWIWSIIAVCFLIYVSVVFVKSVRRRELSVWEGIKKWMVNVIDIFSGGG